MKIEIRQIEHAEEKRTICRAILEALPEWFGIPASAGGIHPRERGQALFCRDGRRKTRRLSVSERDGARHGRAVCDGRFEGAAQDGRRGARWWRRPGGAAREAGYAFMQVKTVQMGKYAEYDATNRFYLAMGFKEFEVFPHLWDEWNPCQVYVMGL